MLPLIRFHCVEVWISAWHSVYTYLVDHVCNQLRFPLNYRFVPILGNVALIRGVSVTGAFILFVVTASRWYENRMNIASTVACDIAARRGYSLVFVRHRHQFLPLPSPFYASDAINLFQLQYSFLLSHWVTYGCVNDQRDAQFLWSILFHSFLSALHVSNESSRSSSGAQHNILYYTHSLVQSVQSCCKHDLPNCVIQHIVVCSWWGTTRFVRNM